MNEIGLEFNAPLMRQMFGGRQVPAPCIEIQTRRLVQPQPKEGKDFCGIAIGSTMIEKIGKGEWAFCNGRLRADGELISPPVLRGDRIFVREDFGYGGDAYTPDIYYRYSQPDAPIQGSWHSASSMRKEDARLWLKVVNVHADRLQSITRSDSIYEGCPFMNEAGGADPRKWFSEAWDSNGGNWAANPWVWIIYLECINRPR